MDLSTDSGTLPTHTAFGGRALEEEPSVSGAHCQVGSDGTILLQLLEFKTHLLEVLEELHIRRDAETRFEDQISKLVLEKQELEWEKESLQHQIETGANQHTESLANVKKQFQAKLRNTEEEKGKYQVTAELKEKEINNLKEELKSLQLLKYNLEKKSSELEQKLALQSRTKDSHLNQLGEVEKRFSALSRQCATVKQAHQKLEQNVDEAMKINKKLTTVREKQEATIVSLKKELDEVSKKLIEVKMTSVRHDRTHSPTGREQRIQQLHQRLNVETEMNKKLREENAAERAEKQEVLSSLQHTQHLLLSQTQTVRRVELELQTQRQTYQALKQEHEVMREKSKAVEDKVAQLMESYAASKTSWDKEKTKFLDRIKSEQEDLRSVKEAYNDLHQKHTELSSQDTSQAQHRNELEMRNSSQSLSVSAQLFPTLVEEIRGEEALHEPVLSSERPGLVGFLQHLVSYQAKNPDRLEDTGAMTERVSTGATGEQEVPNHHQQSQFKQPFTCPHSANNLFSLCCVSGTAETSILSTNINSSDTSESDPDVVPDLINTAFSVTGDDLQISKGSCVSDGTAAWSFGCGPPGGSVAKEKSEEENRGKNEKGQRGKDDGKEEKNNREEINTEQRGDREAVQGEDVKEGGSAGEKRGTLVATDRREGSAEDVGETSKPGTETEDRAGGEDTDGVKERGKTAVSILETQIPAQTATDTTTEKSHALQVTDFMDAEPPLAVCEPVVQSPPQNMLEKDADSSHLNKEHETGREGDVLCSDEHQSVSQRPHDIIQEVQQLCHGEVRTFCRAAESPNHQSTPGEKPSKKTTGEFSAELPNQSSRSTSQINDAPLAGQADGTVDVQEGETSQMETCNADVKQTDEMCNTHVTKPAEPQPSPQSQEALEQERGQLRSVVTDDEAGDSSGCKRRESQPNVNRHENKTCETGPVEKSWLQDAYVDATTAAAELASEAEAGTRQEHVKTEAETTKSETDLKLSVHPSHEDDKSSETSSSKCREQPLLRETPLRDSAESSLPSKMTYRSLFEWRTGQRTLSSRAKSDVSALRRPVQGPPLSGQNTSGPVGFLGQPPSTTSVFLKSKHDKVPLVIIKASELLNASSVSGTAASLRRHRQGEAVEEACGETAAADTDSGASLSHSAFPGSSSSSKSLWQTTPECGRAAGSSSVSDWESSCSQEREDQQSSFRAQISKIEQFLNTERLRLPKRRQTDN